MEIQKDIAKIVAHLLSNEQELVAIIFGNACLLNVDEIEKNAIIKVLTTDPKLFFQEGE